MARRRGGRRSWNEREHPRNPETGEFVRKGTGQAQAWASRVSSAMPRGGAGNPESGLTPEQRASVERLRERGAPVNVFPADLSSSRGRGVDSGATTEDNGGMDSIIPSLALHQTPARDDRDRYNRDIYGEGEAISNENAYDEDTDGPAEPDEDLEQLVTQLREEIDDGDPAANGTADELRRYIVANGYADDDELPNAPASDPVTGERTPSPDPDGQPAWEAIVRGTLRGRGYDPDDIEGQAEGFGQDYFEYADDPAGYADAVLDDLGLPKAADNPVDPSSQWVQKLSTQMAGPDTPEAAARADVLSQLEQQIFWGNSTPDSAALKQLIDAADPSQLHVPEVVDGIMLEYLENTNLDDAIRIGAGLNPDRFPRATSFVADARTASNFRQQQQQRGTWPL